MTTRPNNADQPAEDPDVDRLVLAYLDRVEAEGPAALAQLCRDHPAHAERLREVVQRLDCHGLAGRSPTPVVPAQLDGFEIVREIGRGGMGVVYEAREVALDRRVAIKVMLAHLTNDTRTVERFRREGRTVGSLHHPGIVQVHAVGHDRGHDYLVMEFLDGSPLDATLTSATELGPEASGVWGRGHIERVVEWTARLADALHHAHRAGVIHRDVKPSNVIICNDDTPVLTDFGLARRDDMPGLTRSGAFAGTPAYMAPEQAKSGAAIDARTDVFSLGAVLYELLTLRRPFAGATSHELLDSIQTEEPIDPQRHNRRVSSDLAAVVLRALEKEPRRRYQSAAAFGADLRAFLDYRPVQARRASAAERARRWLVRQPVRAALVAVIALSVPTVTGLAGVWFANRGKVAAAEAQARRDAVDAAIDLAYILGFGSQRDAAVQELERALVLEPDSVEALAGLAMHTLRAEDVRRPSAAAGASTLALLAPREDMLAEHRVLRRIRAWALDAVGRDGEAQTELQALGEPKESLEAFWTGLNTMRTVERESGGAPAALHHLLDAEMLAVRPRPAIYIYLAHAAGSLEDESTARRVARALQALWPNSFHAHRGVGLALFEVDPPAAVAAYRRALEIREDHATRNNLGRALARMGRSEDALAEWQRVMAVDPNDAAAYALAGREYFARWSDPETAIEYLRRAVELDVDQPVAWHYLLWALAKTARLDEALTLGRQAVAALPEEVSLWISLSNVLVDRGEVDAAIAALTEAARIAPSHLRVHTQLAQLYEGLDRLDDAQRERELEVAVAGPQRDAEARYDLAVFLLADRDGTRRDAPRAERMAEQLVAQWADDPWYLELWGAAQQANGHPEVAVKTFTRARAAADAVEHANRKILSRRLAQRIEKLEAQLADQ
ncbi:MAG: protein kinase [Planctomycetota bacterium]